MDSITDIIRTHYQTLSPKKKNVADFIIRNISYCAYFNASDLAAQCGVSAAQIVKFYKSLGFSSYKEMHLLIQAEAAHRTSGLASTAFQNIQSNLDNRNINLPTFSAAITLQQWIEKSSGDLSQDCMTIVKQDLSNIETTLQLLSFPDLDNAAKDIAIARRVAFIAQRSTAGCNSIPATYLSEMRPNVFPISSEHNHSYDMLKWWDNQDIAIGINLHNYHCDFSEKMLQFSAKRGCKTILITDVETYVKTENDYYDYVFQFACNNALTSFTSLIILYNLLDCLVAKHLGQSSVDSILYTEQILQGNI